MEKESTPADFGCGGFVHAVKDANRKVAKLGERSGQVLG
jgi:hypothetical protein